MVHDAEGNGLVGQRGAGFVDAQRDHEVRLLAADGELEEFDEGEELAVRRAAVFLLNLLPLLEHGTDFCIRGHGLLLWM